MPFDDLVEVAIGVKKSEMKEGSNYIHSHAPFLLMTNGHGCLRGPGCCLVGVSGMQVLQVSVSESPRIVLAQ